MLLNYFISFIVNNKSRKFTVCLQPLSGGEICCGRGKKVKKIRLYATYLYVNVSLVRLTTNPQSTYFPESYSNVAFLFPFSLMLALRYF